MATADRPWFVIVCSFNRGRFLEHAVTSAERHLPEATVWIADDRSDDPDTVAVLERLGTRYRILQPEVASVDNPKVGGLYANMQMALDTLPVEAMFLFLQDDMQIVRALDATDHERIAHYFDTRPSAAFLWLHFLRGYRRDDYRFHYDAALEMYFRDVAPGEWGAHFQAAVAGRVDRLRAVDWRFENREKKNDAAAATRFSKMGFLRDPIGTFLPSVRVYRNRQKSRALKLAERRMGAGFHPFESLEGESLMRLRERDPAALPFAEDWLTLEQETLERPFQWGPFQSSRWLRKLDKVERFAGRLRRSSRS